MYEKFNVNDRIVTPQERVDIASSNTENHFPLDRVREIKDYTRLKLAAIIVAAVLLTCLLIYLLCAILINPLGRLTVLAGINDNCRITVCASLGLEKEEVTIKIDGNYMMIDKGGLEKYYEFDGDKIYQHTSYNGEWTRTEIDRVFLGIDDLTTQQSNDLINHGNYIKDPDNLFKWKMKPDIDVGDYENITARNKLGAIVIESEYEKYLYNINVTFTFDSFGTTKLDLPWEE